MTDRSKWLVSPDLHAREVEIKGEKETVYFRRLPAVDMILYSRRILSDDEFVREGAMCFLIAKSLCKEDGTPEFTLEESVDISMEAVEPLFLAALSVNKMDGKVEAGKDFPSAAKSGSGTRSRSRSAKRSVSSSEK